MIKLRDYQHEAIEHTWRWLKTAKTAPVIVLPTGSGKSIVIAELARRVVELKRRVIVLAHREAVRTYGSANCWTGTTGTLAAMVFELLKAIGEERGA